jgi:hypothetical protein
MDTSLIEGICKFEERASKYEIYVQEVSVMMNNRVLKQDG